MFCMNNIYVRWGHYNQSKSSIKYTKILLNSIGHFNDLLFGALSYQNLLRILTHTLALPCVTQRSAYAETGSRCEDVCEHVFKGVPIVKGKITP